MISKKQLNCVLVSALAVLSLFVSSISACACAHHQQTVESAPSCHVQSHSGHDGTAQTTDAKTSIDEDCTCFVFQPSPYVLTKSGKKSSADQASVSDIPADKVLIKMGWLVETPEFIVESNPDLYLSLLTISKPSRAPPRL
jgi:hypothetical protein